MNQYIITEEELNQIKNDCYHPNTLSCEECEFASDGINPCTWKGANALMDEVMTHPYQSERDIDEWCKVHSEVIKDIQTSAYREGHHDGEVVGAKGERDTVLERLHIWFENYCEGNEDPDLWVAFLHAERTLRQQQGDPR